MKKYLVIAVLLAMLVIAYLHFTSPAPVPQFAQDLYEPLPTVKRSELSAYAPVSGDTRFLELINGSHPIQSEPETALIIPVWPGVAVSTTDITLHENAREAVRQMLEAANEEQAGDFYLSSGYRNEEEQRQTYEEMDDKALVLPPGYSEHQTGLAMDIMAEGVGQFELDGSPEGQWLADNSWEYGLLLRYTDDKREITGIPGEAWHFRYVGQPHAWYCYEHGLCFEEYIDFLKAEGGYEVEIDGVTYTVKYERLGDVPEPLMGAEVSGDNTGGLVTTLCD
jgi:D-alanyl-D-alanine carboxypeptidase